MENEQPTTAPEAGSPVEAGSQGSGSIPQGTPESQPSGTPPVEGGQQPTSSQPTERTPQVSDFYSERKQIRDMRLAMQQQQQQMEEMSRVFKTFVESQKPQAKPLTYDDFMADPDKFLAERDKRLFQTLEERLPQIIASRDTQSQAEREKQEALNLMFPKTSDAPFDDVARRIQSSPAVIQKAQELEMIIEDYGFGNLPPLKAAKAALEIYDAKHRTQVPKNPYAPTKSQMASTQVGGQQPSGGKTVNPNELQEKAEKMRKQFGENPELMLNEQFKNEWNMVKAELSKAAAKVA